MASASTRATPNANKALSPCQKLARRNHARHTGRDARATPPNPTECHTNDSPQFQVSRRSDDRLRRYPARLEPHRTKSLPLRSILHRHMVHRPIRYQRSGDPVSHHLHLRRRLHRGLRLRSFTPRHLAGLLRHRPPLSHRSHRHRAAFRTRLA